jgi:hypothetical protein
MRTFLNLLLATVVFLVSFYSTTFATSLAVALDSAWLGF